MQTLVILKPGWENYPGLLQAATQGLYIVQYSEVLVMDEFWMKFYQSHVDKKYWGEMSEYLSSSTCIFILLEWDCLEGCVIESARDQIVRLRKRYNKTSKDTRNIAHASTSDEDAKRELELVDEFSILQVNRPRDI